MVEDGQVTSEVSMTVSPSSRRVRVKYVAYNEAGYVDNSSQVYLAYNPDSVTLEGPGSVIAGEEVVFSCPSENSFPAASLMWTLDGQDVTNRLTIRYFWRLKISVRRIRTIVKACSPRG